MHLQAHNLSKHHIYTDSFRSFQIIRTTAPTTVRMEQMLSMKRVKRKSIVRRSMKSLMKIMVKGTVVMAMRMASMMTDTIELAKAQQRIHSAHNFQRFLTFFFLDPDVSIYSLYLSPTRPHSSTDMFLTSKSYPAHLRCASATFMRIIYHLVIIHFINDLVCKCK